MLDKIVGDWDGKSLAYEEEVYTLFGPDSRGNFVFEFVGNIYKFLFFEIFDFFEWIGCISAVKFF